MATNVAVTPTNGMSSIVNQKVKAKMKCLMQLAKDSVIDNLEVEIEKCTNDEIRDAYISELNEVYRSELKFFKPNIVRTDRKSVV